MRRKNRRLLRQVFRIAGADKIMEAYLGFFLLMALVLWLVEPAAATFSDSLWYCFAVATTVGFGDIAAVSLLGRVFTVILSIYSIAVVAIFTAVITNFFMEAAKIRASESANEFLEALERLPELSKEELERLSQRAKRYARKR